MIALVKAIKDAGMKPKLWIAPLAAIRAPTFCTTMPTCCC